VLDSLDGVTISADDDATLIRRVRAGDTDAYAVIVRRHAPLAIRTAALLGAGSDAEDVVQEALVKAYRSLDRFREDRPFRPWLLRIVAHEAHNAHRSSRRRSAREEKDGRSLPTALIDPATEVEDREAKERLLGAVGDLPEALRRVVVCRYLLDLDEASTAVVLGVPRGTVKSRLSRGLGRLRAELGTTIEEADRA
jgi:RNA polymerase sigma factor (sigma-70 family)